MTEAPPLFTPVVDNVDLWINPKPLYPRVAVICRWKDAKVFGPRKWPDVAVVGPLRTVRGIDGLIRNLLNNPQIRLVIVDGVDLTPGEQTTEALYALWRKRDVGAADDIPLDYVATILDNVDLLSWKSTGRTDRDLVPLHLHENSDRPGGRIVLPPPEVKPTASAPHGDSGQRVSGDTIADIWPKVLHQAMRFGVECPTHYGITKEIRALVSVVRDPVAAVSLSPWIPGHDQVEEYAKRLYGPECPEGAKYSYGSRMSGDVMDIHRIDQIQGLLALLRNKPDTRAGFATPWIPSLDSGKESGRPCLVGVQFRAVPNGGKAPDWLDDQQGGREHPWGGRVYPQPDGSWRLNTIPDVVYATAAEGITAHNKLRGLDVLRTLHLTIQFRSHDLFAAYPLNLAAACVWLVDWAEKLAMSVGSLTCISTSAHVYDRDYSDAGDIIETRWPRGLDLDLRSTWRVEAVPPEPPLVLRVNVGELRDGFRCRRCQQFVPVAHGEAGLKHTPFCSVPVGIRAIALTPDGSEVVEIFEGRTAESVQRQIVKSGLVTNVSNAMWIGRELQKAEVGR